MPTSTTYLRCHPRSAYISPQQDPIISILHAYTYNKPTLGRCLLVKECTVTLLMSSNHKYPNRNAPQKQSPLHLFLCPALTYLGSLDINLSDLDLYSRSMNPDRSESLSVPMHE